MIDKSNDQESIDDDSPDAQGSARRVAVPFPDVILRGIGARVLDPVSAPRLSYQTELRPTAYIGNSLLLGGLPDGSAAAVRAALEQALHDAGLEATVDVSREDLAVQSLLAELGNEELSRLADLIWVTRVRLTPVAETAPQIDAFDALQRLRAQRNPESERAALNHVMSAGGGTSGVAFWGGHGTGVAFWGGHGQSDDPVQTYGGRVPVSWTGGDPAEYAPELKRPPVVVIPDTGLGSHPWFDGRPGVQVGETWHGLSLSPAGLGNPDAYLDIHPLTGALEPLAGHGTFIAGLIRQGCPQARVLSLPVMKSSGVVAEGDLHATLALLLLRHVEGQDQGLVDQVIDVLSLSLGYYHESPADEITDRQFHTLVQNFVDRGVVVVAAAGNDSTAERLYPAGFANSIDRLSLPGLPIASVGALNAAPGSVALFSNSGSWVRTYRQGAGVVSTMPRNFQGPAAAEIQISTPSRVPRGTVDPDDFSSGFGVWSGTSFAAPVFAAQVAAILAATGSALADVDNSTMVARAAIAQQEALTWTRP